jgi:ParB-like nuclease domain
MITNLELHPLADLFPPLYPDGLQELADDIKKNGQLEPIVLYQGKILDGQNRYLAARMAGREPMVKEFSPDETNMGPLEYVWSMNLRRRDLTPSQRAYLAVELLEILREGKYGQPRTSLGTFGPAVTPYHQDRREVAKKARVSTGYVVEAAALKNKDPEAFQEVKTGKKTLREATRDKREKSEEIRKALDRIRSVMGEEARDLIVDGEVEITPSQLVAFAGQATTAIKTIWPLLAEGLPYTDAIKTTGGAILNLSSTLNDLTAKWVEDCGGKKNKVPTVVIDDWRITVERATAENL